MQGDAEFSEVNGWKLRHRLDRWWRDGPRALICMANPSYAGKDDNDPTIHRLIKLTDRPHIAGFTVVNFEPYIATDPADLARWRVAAAWNHEPQYRMVSIANLDLIRELSVGAATRIIAWGNLVPHVAHRVRVLDAMSLDGRHDLYTFGMTQDGSPKHPMARGRHRIPDDVEPVIWRAAEQVAA